MPSLRTDPRTLAETVRFQDGQFFYKINGAWTPVPAGTPLPGSVRPTGGAGLGRPGGLGVTVPLFGAGGERGPIGGATGPGGATLRPGTGAGPIAGSGLPPVSFAPPPAAPAAPPPAETPTPPVSAATPGAPPPPSTGAGGGAGMTKTILDALNKYKGAIAAGGKLAADWRTGRQTGRALEQGAANQSNATDVARFNAASNNTNADIFQRTYLGNNYQRQVGNAIQGGILQGVEDLHIPRPEGVPDRGITGGMRPSAIQGRDEIGAAMQKQAMVELLDPMTVASDPGPGTRRLPALPELPEKTTVPGPSGLDTALDYLGLGGTLAPFLAELIKAAQPTPKPTYQDLPITPPDPLVVQMPNVPIGNAPGDPYGTQGLIDTLNPRTRNPSPWGTLYPRY